MLPLERSRESQPFEFMASAVSSEKPKAQIVHEVAHILRQVKEEGRLTIAVVGPPWCTLGRRRGWPASSRPATWAVCSPAMRVATHDIEQAIFGTSLGIHMDRAIPAEHGHEHHLRAINTIRRYGSIRKAVEAGVLTSGIMHACVTRTHRLRAGRLDPRRRAAARGDHRRAGRPGRDARLHPQANFCLMVATTLHSIAVGNLLPAWVPVVCVDISQATVTKLADRGSWQTVGIVTDVGLFVEQLADELTR